MINLVSPCWRSILLTTTLSPCLQSMPLFFCLVGAHGPYTFMPVFCTSKLFTPYHHCKIFWAYDLPLQHSSATREFYQFVSWWLQEQELIWQQQRQCQRLVRKRKGVSQQQEHVNGVNANQRSDEVKYSSQNWWGMQRGAHICQRSNMQRMVHIISIYYCWIISVLILYLLSLITLQDK